VTSASNPSTPGPTGRSLPTGEQHRLRRGAVTATVTELAASLRALTVDGADLVHPYPDDLPPVRCAGEVLVPWPNRVAGARWTLDGAEQLLDVTEPDKGNALHGLLRNTGYQVVERTDDAVTLAATVFPQHGYPFLLRAQVAYRLTDDGLEVTHRVVNGAARPAPVAVGAHPYLAAGERSADELTLRIAADTVLDVDEKGIPTGRRPVEGTGLDLRGGRRLEGMDLDTPYTDLALEDGARRHRLQAPDGTTTELWAEPVFSFVQVFTYRQFTGLSGPESAVAVEPMTAPADALNTGEGLRWLEPGEEWQLSWGLRRSA
jgi:aldose 1-epimerase